MNSRNVLCTPGLPLGGCGVTAVLRLVPFENDIQTTTEGGAGGRHATGGAVGAAGWGCFEGSWPQIDNRNVLCVPGLP